MTDNEQAPLPVEESPDVTTPQPSGESPTPVVKRKKQWWIIPLIVLAVIVILLTGGFFGVRWLEQRNIASAQQKLAASQYAEAEKDLETLIKIPVQLLVSPSDIYGLRGEARFKQGRDAEALTDLKTAQQFNPNSARTVLLETEILYKQGNTDLALESARKANGLDDTLSFPYALLAEDAYRTGDLATALEKADAAITRNDTSGIAHRVRGSILTWQSDYTPALEDLKQVVAFNPDDVVAQAIQCYALLEIGKKDEAQQILDAIPAEKGEDPAVLWARSLLAQRNYQIKEANDLINQAIEADPNHPEYYVARYEYANTHDEVQTRLADLEKALEISPEFVPAMEKKLMYQVRNWEITDIPSVVEPLKTKAPQSITVPQLMGVYHLLRYEYEKAREVMDEAIKSHPEYFSLYLQRAQINNILHDYTKVQADLQKAAELEPGSPSVLIEQSNYALEKDDYTQALSYADQAIKVYPDSAAVYAQKALINYYKGSISNGRTAADKALKIDPRSSDALMASAYVAMAEKDNVSALNAANTMVETYPKDPSLLTIRGVIYLETDQIDKARKDAAEALRMHLNDTSARALMVDIGIAEGNYDAAVKNAEHMVRIDPKNISGLVTMARAQSSNGDVDKAISTLKQAETFTPDKISVISAMAETYFLQGDLENAKKYIEKVIAREKDIDLDFLEEMEKLKVYLDTFTPAGNGQYTYTDDDLKFSFTLPAGWVPGQSKSITENQTLALTMVPKGTKGTAFLIEFIKTDSIIGVTPAILASYMRTVLPQFMKAISDDYKNFTPLGPAISLKGSKEPVVTETYQINGSSKEVVKLYYAIAHNHLVIMMELGSQSSIEKYQKEVDAAVASFTLIK